MNKKLEQAWDSAFANPGESFHIGNIVVCDDCGVDFTEAKVTGGLIFQSKALCPNCGPKWKVAAVKFDETRYIKAECPAGVSFADFVRKFRGPDTAVTVHMGAQANAKI